MTTALEGVRGQRHVPPVLYLLERLGTHCTGGWVGPRAGLDRCGKFRHHRDFLCKTCTLLFFEVYIIVPLYTCFVLCLIGVSDEFSGRVWGLGGSLGLPLDPCVCAFCVVWCVVLIFSLLLFLVI